MQKIDLSTLNDEQKKAVLQTQGPVLVTAGAGSGKTKVLTYRIANLLEKGVNPSEIIAITFTNKAANEMKTRVQNLIGDHCEIWISTFHSACVKMLHMFNNSHFSIYDDKDSEKIVKNILKQKDWDVELADVVLKHLGEMKNNCYKLNEYLDLIKYERYYDNICVVMAEYEQLLEKCNALDFDDLLLKTYFLLKENKEAFDYFNERFSYVLVDEFQDTNVVQYNIVKLLSFKKRNIFVVGDEDQCIYTWRGAKMENIINFENDFSDAKVFKLEQNYRSTKKILDCANLIIKNNTSRYAKKLYTENDDGVRVEYFSAYTEIEEADYIAQQIINLKHCCGYRNNDFAILIRLNSMSGRLESALTKYNLPYNVFGGVKFYARKEIKNFLSYLKFIINPQDDENFVRMLSFPRRGIGEVAIENLRTYDIKHSIFENMKDMCEQKIANKKINDEYENILKIINFGKMDKSIFDYANFIFNTMKMEAGFDEKKEEDVERLQNIRELFITMKEFEKNNMDASLQNYIQSVTLTMHIDDLDDDDEKITIATIHAAKGLEFKVVFVFGLEENRFPLTRKATLADIEEERRLMYVAITRAEQRLYLTNAKQGYSYSGDSCYYNPSRFLKELGYTKDLTKRINNDYEGNNYKREEAFTKMIGEFVGGSLKDSASMIKTKTASVQYEIGQLVLHQKFGLGRIKDMNIMEKSITILFNDYGIKTLMIDAPLKIIKE